MRAEHLPLSIALLLATRAVLEHARAQAALARATDPLARAQAELEADVERRAMAFALDRLDVYRPRARRFR